MKGKIFINPQVLQKAITIYEKIVAVNGTPYQSQIINKKLFPIENMIAGAILSHKPLKLNLQQTGLSIICLITSLKVTNKERNEHKIFLNELRAVKISYIKATKSSSEAIDYFHNIEKILGYN